LDASTDYEILFLFFVRLTLSVQYHLFLSLSMLM